MSQKVINTSVPNDHLGDALRDAFNDTNANFTELYNGKVDKVTGKDLSDNNLTDELVTKINSIDDNAAINVQSDWLQNDNTKDDFIKNKPAISDVKVPSKVNISFDFPLNAKTDLDSLHGTFLINGSESGTILNSTTPITGVGGLSKVMAIVNAGTVLTGSLIITGISVDRITGVETPGDTETIPIDGLSTNNSTLDSNGNQVHSYINNYISTKWWKGSLTFSTPDLDLTDIIFSQIAFEQFDDVEDLVIDSLDATYKINNTNAEMDAYMYAVEVNGSSANLTMISELHHEIGLEVDAVYRRKQKNLNVQLNGTTDGVFIDLFLAPSTLQYFSNFTMKTWGTIKIPIGFYIDNTFIVDSIIYGETLNAGEIVYLAADGKYYKADNTDISTATTQIRLILEGGILDNIKNALVKGKYSVAGLTAGNEFLGVNGGITSTPPTGATEVVRIISTAISTSKRYFNPSISWLSGDGSIINGVSISPESAITISDAWSIGGLDVRAYATNAPILDNFYTGDAQTVTVGSAPTTINYLRYDAIVMDVNGIISVQAGTEGIAALPPSVDTDNYYLIRYLLIAYGETSPTDTNGNHTTVYNILYDETGTEAGGESNVTVNDASITINNPGSPFGGVGIRGVNVPRFKAYMYFTYTTKKLFSDLTGLRFNFKQDSGDIRNRIFIYFNNGTVRVGGVTIMNGNYGFSASSTLEQNIYIPKENFKVLNTEFDTVLISVYTVKPIIQGYWVDDVELINAYVYNPNLGQSQKQSDWTQTDENSVDFIKNKPSIGTGDMEQSTYDPTTVNGDAFLTDNFSNSTTSKTTPIDADNLTIWDSITSSFKKLSISNLKTFLNTLYVTLTANQTISGVKTFSSSPIVPAPTTNLQAATKKYVDDNSGGITADSVGLNELKDELKARVNMGTGTVINWLLGISYIHDVLTGNITITDSNLPTGTDTKTITLDLIGDFVITVPIYWVWKGGVYNGTVMNKIVIDCINGNGGSEEIYYTIVPNA